MACTVTRRTVPITLGRIWRMLEMASVCTCTEPSSWALHSYSTLDSLNSSFRVASGSFNPHFRATKLLFLLSHRKQSQSAYLWRRNELKYMFYHFGSSDRNFSARARFGAKQARLKGRWPPLPSRVTAAAARGGSVERFVCSTRHFMVVRPLAHSSGLSGAVGEVPTNLNN